MLIKLLYLMLIVLFCLALLMAMVPMNQLPKDEVEPEPPEGGGKGGHPH